MTCSESVEDGAIAILSAELIPLGVWPLLVTSHLACLRSALLFISSGGFAYSFISTVSRSHLHSLPLEITVVFIQHTLLMMGGVSTLRLVALCRSPMYLCITGQRGGRVQSFHSSSVSSFTIVGVDGVFHIHVMICVSFPLAKKSSVFQSEFASRFVSYLITWYLCFIYLAWWNACFLHVRNVDADASRNLCVISGLHSGGSFLELFCFFCVNNE